MNLIKVNQDQSIVYPYSIDQLKIDYPQTSFMDNINLLALASYGVYEVINTSQSSDPYKSHIENTPVLIDGKWYQSWAVVDMTQEEIDSVKSIQWEDVRRDRNSRLSESDWTQLNDAPLTTEKKSEWVSYRQSLRDITLQSDPFNVNWPVKPV
jgi:hypothetical protein